ncbi:cytochrome P450 [Aspergillus indologenus CBS 114.80]|uniref:Cytochrome P450 n=1 Tax=Aspergillus indologenus CBS 114.80 TaxID=1450541 RepID=A0A2V5JA73_9EURO|nr:cytochrome P450 [Aspergillus indologenus CBS 114.80]
MDILRFLERLPTYSGAQVLRFLATSCLLWSLAWLTKILYNIHLHPLARYPGSRLYAASSIPLVIAQLRGRWHVFVQDAHEKYGPVVRIGPSELSYTSAAAWQDIYGRRKGSPQMPRDRAFFNKMLVDSGTITMADDDNHARLRRSLAPAFSPKALVEQESILMSNIDMLLDQLQRRSEAGLVTDLRAWYNYTTFDLLGDFAFGSPFGCLKASGFHEWVQLVVDYFYIAIPLQAVHRFWPLDKLLAMLLPASLVEKKNKHNEMALEKARSRLATTVDRPDFIHYMQNAVRSGSMTNEEVEKQSTVIILAGSETTSIALTYATYFLVTHQAVLRQLRAELLQHFQSESEITMLAVNQSSFLQAVLQETLRLRPPITNGFPRQTPAEGAVIDGRFVPAGTTVNVHHWSAYHSATHFALPDGFHPERWMGDPRFADDCRDCFQPFSVGPRNCVAQRFAYDSMKLTLARLLWRFDVSLAPATTEGEESQPWIRNHESYVSWYLPPLNVTLNARA